MSGLAAQGGKQVLTVEEVYAEMLATGTSYAESTVFKTMQRMKEPTTRPPYARLERVGREGFRLLVTEADPARFLLGRRPHEWRPREAATHHLLG